LYLNTKTRRYWGW